MEFLQVIHERRTIRDYTDAPVETGTLRGLIDAAIHAPSAVNEQPWFFSVVQDRALMDRMSAAVKAHVAIAPPKGVPAEHIQKRLGDPDYHVFYHAPALILISSVTSGQWTIENCALAAENLMLAAYAAGLGSCWIGFAQGWLGTPDGKAAIQLPRDYVPVAPIIVGHPKRIPAPTPRKEPRIARIHWVDA